MDEKQNQTTPSVTEEAAGQQSVNEPADTNQVGSNGSIVKYVLIAALALAVLVVVTFFVRNQDESMDANGISPTQVVATVGGVDILGADLSTSISQITATAQLQGVDTTDPGVQSEIRSQAVEMLINTEVLEQEADERGIEITEADVNARIELLVQEIGSEDLLSERMTALGIDQSTLESDVKSELMIQSLLDEVFVEAGIEVTEEEILSVYEATTAGSETAPELDEVRQQIEAQLQAQKEQQIIDQFITDLRNDVEIQVPE